MLRCSTRPNEWGTQWDLNSLLQVCYSSLLTITVANYLSLPPTRHDLTQGQKPEGRLITITVASCIKFLNSLLYDLIKVTLMILANLHILLSKSLIKKENRLLEKYDWQCFNIPFESHFLNLFFFFKKSNCFVDIFYNYSQL